MVVVDLVEAVAHQEGELAISQLADKQAQL
jgi:hypothetical protein